MNAMDGWRGKYLDSMHVNPENQEDLPKFLNKLRDERAGKMQHIQHREFPIFRLQRAD
jgi:hypothetical protein